jgi:glycosyltransferase involved in cell wall biosynthesis
VNNTKMEQPLVSVALPMLNSRKTIGDAIRSVVWQGYPKWELLVLDDGSNDGGIDLAKDFNDPRIRIMADGVHRGLPAQLNRAVQMARGEYFARMDADDIAYPSRFQKQVEFLQSHPDVDLVGASVAVFRSDGTLLGLRRPPAGHAEICARPWSGVPMVHPTWMGRIQWFRENPYRTDAVRMEDRELLVRTYSHSRFANLSEVLLGYREDSLSLAKLFQARKNTSRLIVEYGREHRKFVLAGTTIAGQIGRFALETLALSTGLGYKILRHRIPPATRAEAEEWKQVWAAIAAAQADAGSARIPLAAVDEAR